MIKGSSISVYCIISEVDRVEIAVSNMTFELDGVHAGQFSRDVDGTMDAAGNYNIHYNVSVFNSGTLPQSNHTLRISSVGYSRMLFDYAEYTYVILTSRSLTIWLMSCVARTLTRVTPLPPVPLRGTRVDPILRRHPAPLDPTFHLSSVGW